MFRIFSIATIIAGAGRGRRIADGIYIDDALGGIGIS